MKVVDDGRYNKVANLVGQTHAVPPPRRCVDQDALVQLGQKDLLIDCQGNWGNILTGDECRRGPIYRGASFRNSPSTWSSTRRRRRDAVVRRPQGGSPVTLPITSCCCWPKGSDGIAVDLASKILPHKSRGADQRLHCPPPRTWIARSSRLPDGRHG